MTKYNKPFDANELTRRLQQWQGADTSAVTEQKRSDRPMTAYLPRNAARAFQQTATSGAGNTLSQHAFNQLSDALLEKLRNAGDTSDDGSSIDRFIEAQRDADHQVSEAKNRGTMIVESDTDATARGPDVSPSQIHRRAEDRPDWDQRVSGEYADGTVNAFLHRQKEKLSKHESHPSHIASQRRPSVADVFTLQTTLPPLSRRRSSLNDLAALSAGNWSDPQVDEDAKVMEYVLSMPRRRKSVTNPSNPLAVDTTTDSARTARFQDDATYAALTSSAPAPSSLPSSAVKKKNRSGVMFARENASPVLAHSTPTITPTSQSAAARKSHVRKSASAAAIDAAKQAALKRSSTQATPKHALSADTLDKRKSRASTIYGVHSPAMLAAMDAAAEARNIMEYELVTPRTAFEEKRPSDATLSVFSSPVTASNSDLRSGSSHSYDTPPTDTAVSTPVLRTAMAAPVNLSSMSGLHGNPVSLSPVPLQMHPATRDSPASEASATSFGHSAIGVQSTPNDWTTPPPRTMQVARAARALHEKQLARARAEAEERQRGVFHVETPDASRSKRTSMRRVFGRA